MGSGKSDDYSGLAYGSTLHSADKADMKKRLEKYAEQTRTELKQRTDLNKKQRNSFNTACIVFDALNNCYYYGRNQGIDQDHPPKNQILFGDENNPGILPKESLESWGLSNCAEIDAVNHALNAGARLENLVIMTVYATNKQFGTPKPCCKNCTRTLKGRIHENFSGWTED